MTGSPDASASDLARQLAEVPLFRDLRSDVLTRTVALAHLKQIGSSEFFFNEGDQAEEFFGWECSCV
jgi:hypothetical protein